MPLTGGDDNPPGGLELLLKAFENPLLLAFRGKAIP